MPRWIANGHNTGFSTVWGKLIKIPDRQGSIYKFTLVTYNFIVAEEL